MTTTLFRAPRQFRTAAVLAATAGCLIVSTPLTPAAAQQVVARVNGEPITAVDLEQRSKLIQASTHKPPPRQEVLNELIDEQLKMQTARRYRMDITDEQVNNAVAGMASRMRANPEQFAQALGQAGISINALKRKIKADIAWNEIVRGKFSSDLMVREKDVIAAAQANKGEKPGTSYQYTLRPILFVVPRGAGDNVLQARRAEAEGLRNRFGNCEEGLKLARGLRDVAIREPITRGSGDLPSKQRELLQTMAVGSVTPPDVTAQGVEVFALCGKSEAKGDAGDVRDVREKMVGDKFNAQGKRYLQELRRSAMIETK